MKCIQKKKDLARRKNIQGPGLLSGKLMECPNDDRNKGYTYTTLWLGARL